MKLEKRNIEVMKELWSGEETLRERERERERELKEAVIDREKIEEKP
jgi:hypothetical protein